jgi:hypothetical protein
MMPDRLTGANVYKHSEATCLFSAASNSPGSRPADTFAPYKDFNCSIGTISAVIVEGCHNNGTLNDHTDDTFKANVTVSFSMPPSSGTLNISGDGMASVNVSAISGNSYTFTDVVMLANGSDK